MEKLKFSDPDLLIDIIRESVQKNRSLVIRELEGGLQLELIEGGSRHRARHILKNIPGAKYSKLLNRTGAVATEIYALIQSMEAP